MKQDNIWSLDRRALYLLLPRHRQVQAFLRADQVIVIVRALVEALRGGYGSVVSNVVYTDSLALFVSKLATMVPQLGPRFGKNGNKVALSDGAKLCMDMDDFEWSDVDYAWYEDMAIRMLKDMGVVV
jgi:hypothetical protein